MKKIYINISRTIGPYSQAVLVDNTLYCSGQIAIRPWTFGPEPKDETLITSDITAETKQIMQNLEAILKEAKMTFSHVVKCSIFLKNMEQYAEVNKVYEKYFDEDLPAREVVEVSKLPKNMNVEISLIAVK